MTSGIYTPAEDGGPAFPLAVSPDTAWNVNGMSLRDYFAAQAMIAIRFEPSDYTVSGFNDEVKDIAKASYAIADAMLKARNG